MRSASRDFLRKATWFFYYLLCMCDRGKGWNIRGLHATGSKRLQKDTAFTESQVLHRLLSRGGNSSEQTTLKRLHTGTLDSEDVPVCEQKEEPGLL